MKYLLFHIIFVVCVICSSVGGVSAQNTVSGTVKDQNGDLIAGANVTIRNLQSRSMVATTTNRDGVFSFPGLSAGEYTIKILAHGFAVFEQTISVTSGGLNGLAFALSIGESRLTVTAEVGQAEEARNVAQAVSVISTEAISQRATSVLAQVGEEEAGLNLQRTSPTIGAVVVRGLTGKNVANFVDGVRFTNGAQRGGINTFFNLNEPTNLQSVEVLRGPNGAQYGSDSLAGTVNLVTKTPLFGAKKAEFHGEFTPGFTLADRGVGSSGLLSYGTQKLGGYVSVAARRIGNLRTSDALDSHSAVTRFLGLPSNVLYNRNPGTGFQQYSAGLRLNYSPRDDQQVIFFYQRGQQDDGKRFDQMLGGDGNLIADLRNLMLDFGYVRYVKQGVGPFDSGSFTLSYNSQREERVNQGGQGNPTGEVTHQYERTSVWGTSFFFDKQLGKNNSFLVGGDYYREKLNSPAFIYNPVTNLVRLSRPRIPDEARFDSGGLFVQDQWDAVPDRLRITGALRYSGMTYRARATDSPVVGGARLWSDDRLSTSDLSGRVGAVVHVAKGLRFAFNYGRGFRYPSMTDLGTLGLTGDGFEVDHITAGALGGKIGTTAGSDAISTSLPVAKQVSEKSNSYDVSLRYQTTRFDAEFTVFRLDLVDAITKQALILPAGSLGRSLGGQTITNQLSNGVVFVPLSASPVLVRANYTSARLWGVEYENEARLARDLVFKANFTYIKAADRDTGLPPNVEGGTPPPNAFLSLRYNRPRFWVEAYSTLAARQARLSSLDLSDRRTGAARSRAQIRDYFRRGACVAGLTTPGAGGCGTAGGILAATGETQLQVQNRLLPIGAIINGLRVADDNTAVPLFTALPGYGVVNLRGGVTINEGAGVFWAFENILDQFYRNPSWGIDGPGRSLSVQFRFKF